VLETAIPRQTAAFTWDLEHLDQVGVLERAALSDPKKTALAGRAAYLVHRPVSSL
jgi:hypothetical protein